MHSLLKGIHGCGFVISCIVRCSMSCIVLQSGHNRLYTGWDNVCVFELVQCSHLGGLTLHESSLQLTAIRETKNHNNALFPIWSALKLRQEGILQNAKTLHGKKSEGKCIANVFTNKVNQGDPTLLREWPPGACTSQLAGMPRPLANTPNG